MMIETGLVLSGNVALCVSADELGPGRSQLEAGISRFRGPLNKECRFLPLRLDEDPIKCSLARTRSI